LALYELQRQRNIGSAYCRNRVVTEPSKYAIVICTGSGQFFARVLVWALYGLCMGSVRALFFCCHKAKRYSTSQRIHRHTNYSSDRYDNDLCKSIRSRIRSRHAPLIEPPGHINTRVMAGNNRDALGENPEVHLEKPGRNTRRNEECNVSSSKRAILLVLIMMMCAHYSANS